MDFSNFYLTATDVLILVVFTWFCGGITWVIVAKDDDSDQYIFPLLIANTILITVLALLLGFG